MAEDDQSRSNRLIAAMPDALRARLEPHLATAPAHCPGSVLAEADSSPRHAYFPHSGVVCLMAPTRKGHTEAATVGPEGFIGFEAVLGGAVNQRVLVQVEGVAARLPIEVLSDLARDSDAFRALLLAYVRCFMVQVLQSVACNGQHSVQERCARWLLMTHDRAGTDRFEMTHQFLGELVGIQRPSVTIAVGVLQDAGLILWCRGKITVRDRPGLEAAACECYGIVREALNENLPQTD